MSVNNKHFYITGSSGFLGNMLVRKLLTRDPALRLTLLQHRTRITIPEEYRNRVTVMADEDFALEGVNAVVHLAAVTHTKNMDLYHAINTEVMRMLLKSAKDSGVKHFVYVSTTALGDSCGAYGASKLEAENAIHSVGVPYTIVRPAEVYGGKNNEGIGQLINIIKYFPVVPYITNTFLAPVHIDDVVNALHVAIYRNPENKTYIIAGKEKLSFYDTIGAIASALRKKVVRVPIPLLLVQIAKQLPFFTFAPDQVERLICKKDYNIDLAVQELKFSPRPFPEGL